MPKLRKDVLAVKLKYNIDFIEDPYSLFWIVEKAREIAELSPRCAFLAILRALSTIQKGTASSLNEICLIERFRSRHFSQCTYM